MRVGRAKQIRKALKFYRIVYGIVEPYQVLLDGNFLAAMHKMKLDLQDRVPKLLQAKCNFFVTPCILDELEKLGPQYSHLVVFARDHCKKRNCRHSESLSANECITECIGDKNQSRLFVASQDEDLRATLRQVPGVPLFFLSRSVLIFEQPSESTKSNSVQQEMHKRGVIGSKEREMLQSITRAEAPASHTTPIRRKRKAKGPNPLSVKKSKQNQSEELRNNRKDK